MLHIDILVVLGNNGYKMASLLRSTALNLISPFTKIHFKCVTQEGYNKIPDGMEHCGTFPNYGDISMNHASGINMLTRYMESEYVLIADADVVLLYKEWDSVLVNMLKHVNVAGLPNDKIRAFRNFPSATFLFTKSSYLLRANIDFRPINYKNKRGAVTVEVTHNDGWTGIPVGHKFTKDTGWRIPREFKKLGMTGKCLEIMDKQNEFSLLQRTAVAKWNDDLFLAHLRFSSIRRKELPSDRMARFHKIAKHYLLCKYGIVV